MDVTIPCVCGAHDEDTVTLRDTLPPRDALAISKDIEILRFDDPDATGGDVLAVLSEGYILRGVEAWTLQDDDGKPLPVTKSAVREQLLTRLDITSTIADVADGLYAEAVMLPLVREGVAILAAYADGGLDVSADGLWTHAPDALEALLDLHYPDGRHREDIRVARWRLQLLAELGVGSLIRQHNRVEARSMHRLKAVTHGRR